MEKRLIEGLSKISNLDVDTWAKIFDNISALIEEYVYESRIDLDSKTDIDLEFATLSLINEDNKLKINFIPKEKMVKELKSIEHGNKSKLKIKLEKSVLNNILETFKEI